MPLIWPRGRDACFAQLSVPIAHPKSDQEGLLEKEKDPLGLIFPSTYVSACMEEILFTLCV